MRPGLFWIDEIWRQWRYATPIVDASIEEVMVIRRRKIGRGLNIDVWHEQARDWDGSHDFALRGIGPGVHWNFGLGAKVLNDYFLNVTVAAMQVTDRKQCVNTIFDGFADANKQAGRERNILFTCFFNSVKSFGR